MALMPISCSLPEKILKVITISIQITGNKTKPIIMTVWSSNMHLVGYELVSC